MESVLLVDDEKDNLEALRRLLRNEFEVTTTESGIEALKLVQAKEFAVIVSDQRMPEITGVDLLEKVKLLKPATVRILLTGYTEVESVIGAINRGNIYRYIAKPWDPEDFKISMHQAADAFRLRKDLDEKNRALQASNAELNSAFEKLQLLDRAKARFLSLVSHELNTPLTAVSAFVALLGENAAALPGDLKRAVTSLSSASDRLSEIVQDVLTYVRLEADSVWSVSPFEWDKEVVAILSSLTELREKKQVEFTVQAKPGLITETASEKVRLSIRKLIEESLRRTKPSERVQVSIKQENAETVLRVAWKGEPVPKEAFQAFETGGNEAHHHRNLALGLAIAKVVAEKQGGALSTEVEEQLNSIVFTLPAK
jgi:two-component system, sensor histidine kinase and response regulator